MITLSSLHNNFDQHIARFTTSTYLNDRISLEQSCISLPRANTTPTVVEVARGKYQAAFGFLARADVELLEVDGPTGCGKSTFFLWELAQLYGVLLIVCPTCANVGNILNEFNSNIPKIQIKNGFAHNSWIPAAYSRLLGDKPEHKVLVTTADDYRAYVLNTGHAYPAKITALDEYHQTIESMLFCVAFSRHCLTMTKFIFISATPPGRRSPRPNMAGKRFLPLPVSDPLSAQALLFIERKSFREHGSGVTVVVVEGCAVAHELFLTLCKRQIRKIAIICKHTRVTEAMKICALHSDVVIIITPDVDSGITIDMSVFIDFRTEVRTVFSRGILFEERANLTMEKYIQRTGRVGRRVPGIIFANDRDGVPVVSDLSLAYASILIQFIGIGIRIDNLPFYQQTVKGFPRIGILGKKVARSIMLHKAPVSQLYTVDDDGSTYVEFGGTSTNFAKQNLDDLKVFTWADGYVLYPFFSLLTDHNLEKAFPPEVAKTVARAVIKANPGMFNIDSALKTAEANPHRYAQSLFDALVGLFNYNNTTNYSAKSLDYEVPSGDVDKGPEENFGSLGARVWAIIVADGGSMRIVTHRSASGASAHKVYFKPIQPELDYTFICYIYRYGSAELIANNCEVLHSVDGKNVVDQKRVEKAIIKALEPLMAASILLADAGKTVNLLEFSNRIAYNSNTWAKTLKL